MKERIHAAIHDPVALEKLYRENHFLFEQEFPSVAKEFNSDLVRFWTIRLQKDDTGLKKGADKSKIWTTVLISAAVALLVWLPVKAFGADPDNFYIRNLATIVFSGLITWFIFKNRLPGYGRILSLVVPVVALASLLNLIPGEKSDTSVLSFIHAPLFLWFIFAFTFLGTGLREHSRLSPFIRFNGELVTMTGLILIAFAILSGLTISLFFLLGKQIGELYMENIFIVGLAVSPVVAACLTDLYPDITTRIAPLIARIFAPLALLASVIYLIALLGSGISISENREVLIIFNLLLVAVMAIILFSVSEHEKSKIRPFHAIILFLLTIMTLIIDLFALHAILSRLSDGMTPNRTVVLISNLLILVNLVLLLPGLFKSGFKGGTTEHAEKVISLYLPVYLIYSIFIIFIFPFIFGFR